MLETHKTPHISLTVLSPNHSLLQTYREHFMKNKIIVSDEHWATVQGAEIHNTDEKKQREREESL